MKKILLIEGRQSIGGGQIVSLAVCKALAIENKIITFLPGDEKSPVALLLRDYEQCFFVQHEYSRGQKSFKDIFRLIMNCFAFLKLRRVIKSRNVDILYVQHASMLPTILIACLGVKVKVFVHLHVVYSDERVRQLMNWMLSSNKISLILGVSNYTFTQLQSSLLRKSEVIYNPIPILTKQPDKNIRNIAIVGDVISLKGQHVLFEAVSMMSKDYHIHIIGNIVDYQYKEKLLKDYPKVNATFTGMIQDVTKYMRKNKIGLVAITSTAKFETFSLAMVEAWSQGIPTVATNDFGMKELVNRFLPQYKDTMLFEINKPEDLKNKIKSLAENDCLYSRISEDVRLVVVNNLNENIFSDKLREIIMSH